MNGGRRINVALGPAGAHALRQLAADGTPVTEATSEALRLAALLRPLADPDGILTVLGPGADRTRVLL